MKDMKRIAINIGGGYVPGINAVVAGTDQRAVAMCLLSIFITVTTGFGAAAICARFAPDGLTAVSGGRTDRLPHGQPGKPDDQSAPITLESK